MIRKILVFVAILTILAMHAGMAFAAPLSAGEVVELESAHGGASGTVFIFKVDGEFSGAELQGSVQTGDGTVFPLYCAQLNAETVRCLTSSKVWGDVTVTFGGISFATRVGPFERVFSSTPVPTEATPTPTDVTPTPTDVTPTPTDVTPTPTDVTPTPTDVTPTPTPTQYCYDVYAWSNPSIFGWSSLGTNCQDSIANYGDTISFPDPNWGGGNFTYQFMPNNPSNPICIINRTGDAYYYPTCPYIPN